MAVFHIKKYHKETGGTTEVFRTLPNILVQFCILELRSNSKGASQHVQGQCPLVVL